MTRTAVALAASLVLVVACGPDVPAQDPIADGPQPQDPAPTSPADPPSSESVRDEPDESGEPDAAGDRDPGGQARHLDVAGRSLAGGTVELASFVGRPLALWMWTPW